MLLVVATSWAQTMASISGASRLRSEYANAVPKHPTPAPLAVGNYNSYHPGSIVLNAGLSVGLIGVANPYGTPSGFLPITLSGEFSITEEISAGAFVAFYTNTYHFSGYEGHDNYFSVGARGVFHGTHLLNDKLHWRIPGNIDLYGAAILGVQSRSIKYNYPGANTSTDTEVIVGPSLGGRYMFTDFFGVYAEVGRNPLGVVAFGASVKF